MRTLAAWQVKGDEAAYEDWRAKNRVPTDENGVRSALLGHFDADLHDPEITKQTEADIDEALTAVTRGYVDAYRRLGGIVLENY